MCIRDRCMAERACVVEGDLSDTIDQLYEGQWINKATKDNYHTTVSYTHLDVYKRQASASASSLAVVVSAKEPTYLTITSTSGLAALAPAI